MSEISQFCKRRRILVIYNPVAGLRRRQRIHKAVAALRALGLEVSVRISSAPGDAERQARQALSEQTPPEAVVAAGGDGTLNEIANGLVGSDIPLSLLSLGNANVFATEAKIPSNLRDWAAMIASAEATRIHVGTANGRHFVAMVSAGFDSRAVAEVDLSLKRLIGRASYGIAGLSALATAGSDCLQVVVDGRAFDAGWVIVAKTRLFAGPFRLVPTADLFAKDLGVTVFPPSGGIGRSRDLTLAALGVVERVPGVHFLTAREVVIECKPPRSRAMPLQMDGDKAGVLPARVTPGPSLPFLLPKVFIENKD